MVSGNPCEDVVNPLFHRVRTTDFAEDSEAEGGKACIVSLLQRRPAPFPDRPCQQSPPEESMPGLSSPAPTQLRRLEFPQSLTIEASRAC